jgi:type II secretory pathway pseudopilin PulG
MNNQVMLEALEAQLSVKQSQVDKYREEVYSPQLQELKKNTVDRLNSTLCPDRYLIKAVDIHSESLAISINEKERYGSTIRFETRGWNDENRSYRFVWYSGEVTTGEGCDRDYGILVGRISEKFDQTLSIVKDNVLPAYRKLEKDLEAVNSSLNELERSIRQLKQNIELESKAHYYKPGFHLKLKEFKILDWVSADHGNSDERILVSQPGSIKLIVGRSKYDNEWVREFKVIKKKGYKYELEVVTNWTDGKTKSVEVTEMRMQEFVDSVYYWETVDADKRTKRAEERLAEIEASKNSTTLPTL